MESHSLDALGRKLLHALQVDGRAPFSRIAEVRGPRAATAETAMPIASRSPYPPSAAPPSTSAIPRTRTLPAWHLPTAPGPNSWSSRRDAESQSWAGAVSGSGVVASSSASARSFFKASSRARASEYSLISASLRSSNTSASLNCRGAEGGKKGTGQVEARWNRGRLWSGSECADWWRGSSEISRLTIVIAHLPKATRPDRKPLGSKVTPPPRNKSRSNYIRTQVIRTLFTR